MNRNTIIAAFFALVFLAGQNALAQSGYDLFQKGLVAERTEGDLDEAIRLYKQIVENHKDDRALVAKTLIQMGGCYEKLGRAEARKAYERVVQEFTDQPEPVRVARRHLEQLDGGALGTAGNGPTYRLVLDDQIAGMPVGFRDFSPSGDRIVFRNKDASGLYITDQTGTVIRPIIEDLGPWEEVGWPSWSPDGRLIAYTLSRGLPLDSRAEGIWAILVLSPDGGTPRQIGPEVRRRITWGLRWTPDGKHLTYRAGDGLHTLTLDGDEVRFIPKEDLPGQSPRGDFTYSPNGRWLTICCGKENSKSDRDTDIWILPATGGAARRLTQFPWLNGHATWAPDGRTLYFISGTSGSNADRNIWKLAMDPETGTPKDEPQQVTFFKDVYAVFLKALGDGDRIAFTMWRQNTSIQVADASSPREAQTLARGHSPQLSPDGQTVYYVNDTPGEQGIYAVPRQGGAPRRLTKSLPTGGLDLSPDGRTLAYVAELGEERGLYTLPTSGGEPILLVKSASVGRGGQWSPDGSSLAYTAGKILYVIPGTGGKPHEVAQLGREWDDCIRWSPDGKFIAGLGWDKPEGTNRVFVVPASGGELRQLTPDVEYWKSPYKQSLEWHPDGKRLTYHVSQYDSETRQVYLDGRPPSLLLDAPGVWDYEGAWAPDSLRFFFVAHAGSEQGGIYVYNEASGKTTLVNPVGNNVGVPSWSRDGKTMAWWATRQTSTQTWVMENFLTEATAEK